MNYVIKVFKCNLDIILYTLYIFSLPISHFAAVQSILSLAFLIYFLYKNSSVIKINLFFGFYKNIVILFFLLFFLAMMSLFNTPDIIESLKEIKSEIIVNFITLVVFFYYSMTLDEKKLKILFLATVFVLTVHTFINIFIWAQHGFWPFRSGGLLDSQGVGERFGIWATYMLSAAISYFYINKKTGFFLFAIAVVSIIANQTRATFISAIMIMFVYIMSINKKRFFKFTMVLILLVSGIVYYNYSDKLSQRYNIKHIIINFNKVLRTPPKEFDKIGMEYSTYTRLSMWKSALLYRYQHPFVPQEYGRFLFGKSIVKNFKNKKNNLPVVILAQTHNEFIGILYALGVFGLMLFLYLLYIVMFYSKKLIDSQYNYWGIFIFLGTIGFIGSMMFGSFFGDSESKFFYVLFGILLGVYYKNENYSS